VRGKLRGQEERESDVLGKIRVSRPEGDSMAQKFCLKCGEPLTEGKRFYLVESECDLVLVET
jgi:hypothetical protein